ncbi:MAG TPA: DUF1870 family protein [Candidatus Dormibacteraeota bacterium]|jgi:DNA-binding transcriptional regulator YiaG
MASIATIAAEHDMQPHELLALTGLDNMSQADELDADTETFVRDLVANTDTDGVYRTTMTAAEFQATREALGLTGDWLAGHLGVSPRTVRHWEQGKYAIPEGVYLQMHQLAAAARAFYKDLVRQAEETIGRGEPARITVYRSTEDYHAAEPTATMPASWHRAVAWRVREHLIIVGLTYPNDAPKRA